MLTAKLKSAGVAVTIGGLVAGGLWHWYVAHDRKQLKSEVADLTVDLTEARASNSLLELALETEREATAIASAERDRARRSLVEFERGRRDDPEAIEWASQPIPEGELERLCDALPEMRGCPITE